MEEKDISLQYLREKIEKYEAQLKGVMFHLNHHREVYRRLKSNPQTILVKATQMEMFA